MCRNTQTPPIRRLSVYDTNLSKNLISLPSITNVIDKFSWFFLQSSPLAKLKIAIINLKLDFEQT